MISAESTALIGATYFTGFQLSKETFNASNTNWCCAIPENQAIQIPADWIANRNQRKALPQNYALPQFSAMYDQQSFRTQKILERMEA